MIARYTRPEIGRLWTDAARIQDWREVELAACEEMHGLLGADGPEESELRAIRGASFTVAEVQERELVTEHDVAAFVDVLAASVGEAGRWIHFGLTSSDVLDTALALPLREAGDVIVPGARELVAALATRAREQVAYAVRRAHPRRSRRADHVRRQARGLAFEAHRNTERLERAFAQVAVGAISGAVGTYAATAPQFEARDARAPRPGREPVSTQVVPRDRHAELLSAIALAGAGLERLATEVRHLQRTEVLEVQEPFRAGQKGSSAMPHKRNPIKCEQSPASRACCAATPAALEKSRCGTSATSRTPPSSA